MCLVIRVRQVVAASKVCSSPGPGAKAQRARALVRLLGGPGTLTRPFSPPSAHLGRGALAMSFDPMKPSKGQQARNEMREVRNSYTNTWKTGLFNAPCTDPLCKFTLFT